MLTAALLLSSAQLKLIQKGRDTLSVNDENGSFRRERFNIFQAIISTRKPSLSMNPPKKVGESILSG